MVEYLPCSTNTWELFGINESTILEDYLNTLPGRSSNTSSQLHYNSTYELNAFGEYEEVMHQENYSDVDMNNEIDSNELGGSGVSSSQYDGDYQLLHRDNVISNGNDTQCVHCSVCGDEFRPLDTNGSVIDIKGTIICMKCAEKMNFSLSGLISKDEENSTCPIRKTQDRDCEQEIIIISASSHSNNNNIDINEDNKNIKIEVTLSGADGIIDNPVYKDGISGQEISSQASVVNQKIGGQGKRFSCNICGKHFKWNGNLKVHMRIHSGERPHHCDFCGMQFKASNDLRRHKRRHTGEMPYRCSACPMSFKSNSEMKQHAKIHQGEKPHACGECGRQFVSRSNLKTHMRVHSGERPYKCSDCWRTFRTSTNLKNHLRVHSGIKPYLCLVCGKRFSQSNNLTIHKKMIHDTNDD